MTWPAKGMPCHFCKKPIFANSDSASVVSDGSPVLVICLDCRKEQRDKAQYLLRETGEEVIRHQTKDLKPIERGRAQEWLRRQKSRS